MRLFRCRCKRGREDQRVLVSVEVEIPAALYRRVNKRTLRQRGVRIMGAIWEHARWYCMRCGKVFAT